MITSMKSTHESVPFKHSVQGRIQDFATGGGGALATGEARCMLNHLWCAVGPLHSHNILNFGVSWGLKPPKYPPPWIRPWFKWQPYAK